MVKKYAIETEAMAAHRYIVEANSREEAEAAFWEGKYLSCEEIPVSEADETITDIKEAA